MLRFYIRDLLWLMVLASVTAAWRHDKHRLNQQSKALKAEHSQLAEDRARMQAEFDDKIAIVDRMQREASDRLMSRTRRFGR